MLSEVHGDATPTIERHPERRMKSVSSGGGVAANAVLREERLLPPVLPQAYAAFAEVEMARLKEENPGLRLSQLKNMLQKLVQPTMHSRDGARRAIPRLLMIACTCLVDGSGRSRQTTL
jgi:hypothetical protein